MGQWYARISGSISGGSKRFENIHGLAAGGAVDIRESRRVVHVSRAAQRLSGRSVISGAQTPVKESNYAPYEFYEFGYKRRRSTM